MSDATSKAVSTTDNTHDADALAPSIPPLIGPSLYNRDLHPIDLKDFYKGRSAFLLLSGPSLNTHDLGMLGRRGILTMGVNNVWTVYRPNLWTCVDDPGRFIDTGWKDPGIIKFAPLESGKRKLRVMQEDGTLRNSAFKVWNMPSTLFYKRINEFNHETFLEDPAFCWGQDGANPDSLGITGKRSVMLLAFNLLYYLGVRNVYLVGADFKMAPDRKYAFDEKRTEKAIDNNNVLYDALRTRFKALLPRFEALGFHVYNCANPGDSELTEFPRMDFNKAVGRASRECNRATPTRGWYIPR